MNLRAHVTVILLAGLIGWSCDDKEVEQQAELQAHASAMAEIKQAMMEKNYTRAWEQLATIRIPLGSPEAAEIERLRASVKEKYIAFHLNLGANLKDSGSLGPALKHIDRVLNVDQENPLALKLRGAIAKEMSTGEKIEVEKEKPELEKLLDLGREQSANKKFTEAVETYQKVIKLDEKHCEGHLELGVLYARMGRIKSAAKWYKKFVQICPDHKKVPQIRQVLKDFKGLDPGSR
jgi:tetratricopeptide (TPR) repeat protein